MYSFNLMDKKWIPCIMLDGTHNDMGIKEVLFEASNISGVVDNSPLVTIALHRLLLAILHRSFERGYGPVDSMEWKRLWDRGTFDSELLTSYPDRYHHRFDLFDDKNPFYQCASLASDKVKVKSEPISVANLLHDSAIYLNKATLFDHSTENTMQSLSPAEAARFLITFQCYAIGGFSSLSKPRIKGEESAKAAPIPWAKGAVCLVKGRNLFETLMLNMIVLNPQDEEPFVTDKGDKPAWEYDDEIVPEELSLRGYFHLLTWQSRRIKFLPETTEADEVIIRNVLVRKGNQLPDGYYLYGKETMMAFRKRINAAPGQDPWPPVNFREDKALWRDSLGLFQNVSDQSVRPKTINLIGDLVEHNVIPTIMLYDMSIFGLISAQATISLWRHEHLPLPLQYLRGEESKALLNALREALDLAEDTAKALSRSAWVFAREMLVPTKPSNERLSDNERKQVNNLSISLSLTITHPYWAALGIVFNHFMVELAEDKSEERMHSLREWAGEIRKAARNAFEETTRSLDRTGRMLKAVSIAEREFKSRLYGILKEYLNDTEEGGEQ
jgi:CRISPR system Cascade subunit CasA